VYLLIFIGVQCIYSLLIESLLANFISKVNLESETFVSHRDTLFIHVGRGEQLGVNNMGKSLKLYFVRLYLKFKVVYLKLEIDMCELT